ncbi:MAG: DUF456 family protein [Pirellulaceae bacterium]
MSILWAVLLILAAIAMWSLNFIGLPGNWLVLASAASYAYLIPDETRTGISWWTVGGLLGLALLGEIIEFAAGALGAIQAGASRRGAAMALGGSLVGGVFGLFVALPIPVVGPVVGALLFASLGALGGAVLGEQWKGKDLDESIRIGHAAFWGRLFGTLGKALVGALMIALLLVALIV